MSRREYFIRKRDINKKTGKPIVHSPDRSHHVPGDHMLMDKPITEQDIVDYGSDGVKHIKTHPKKRKRQDFQSKSRWTSLDSGGFPWALTQEHREKDHLDRFRTAINEALSPEVEKIWQQIQDEEEMIADVFGDAEAWAKWQAGERFDGKQTAEVAPPTNSHEYQPPENEDAELLRILEAEKQFYIATNHRRAERRGGVQHIRGNTDRPVPGRTPKILDKK